ncbi:MAG: hypothetical protein ACTSO9_05405 [Candidatus Helarchaeota archaeon]
MVNTVHLLKLEKTGPEIISAYPEVTHKEELRKNLMKLLPFNAKEGEVFSLIAENNMVFLSYIFTIQESQDERPDLYAFGVIFNPLEDFTNYQAFFQTFISELKNNNLLSDNLLINLVPKLYGALKKGKTNIQITKNVTINIKFGKLSSDEKRNLEDKTNDLW